LKINIFNFIRHEIYYQKKSMNTILFLDGSPISLFLLKLIQKSKFFIIKKIITSTNINKFDKLIIKNNISIFKTNFKKKSKNINLSNYDIGFSYYDFKIPKYVLDTIKSGGINFHPSYLPFNRGRHSTFWGIVKNNPLGASAHWLNSNFDDGEIIYQKKLTKCKDQSAKIIYNRQLDLLKKVIINTISLIKNNKFVKKKQNHKQATYHFAKDISECISFKINSSINNIKLSRIIRGTCFNNKTGIYINESNNKFLINSKYIFKKFYKNKKYNIKLKNLFGNLYDKKKIKFTIYLNKKKIIVNSTAHILS
tara:strand:- start:2830 stop:3756 length:927 start_codon:yes stop_codon:yes gene_type:complete